MQRFAVVGVLLAIGAAVSFFTVDSGDVVEFNDELVGICQETDRSFQGYVLLLEQYAGGQQVELAALDREQARIARTVERARSEIGTIDVPDDDLCREFHAAVVAYVDNFAAVADAFEEVNGYIGSHNPGTEADLAAVQELFSESFQQEEVLLAKVQSAQKRMAAEHRLDIR